MFELCQLSLIIAYFLDLLLEMAACDAAINAPVTSHRIGDRMEVEQYPLKTGNIRYMSVKFRVTSGDFGQVWKNLLNVSKTWNG